MLQDARSPIAMVTGPAVGNGQCPPSSHVSESRHDGNARIIAHLRRDIEWFGVLADQAQARYEREHCLTAIGDRDRWRLAQREAIQRREALASTPSA